MAAPAAGGAGLPSGIPQQFEARITGVATIHWVTQRGAVGSTCQDWRYEEGNVTQRFSPKKLPVGIVLQPGKVSGLGYGAGSLRGRIEKTFAFAIEPGCPGVCPGAKVAQREPTARAADCLDPAKRRQESAISCESGSAMNPFYNIKGASSGSLEILVGGTVQPGAEECLKKGDGLPPVKNLISPRKLRNLSRRGTLKISRTLSGECPGTRLLPVPDFAQTTCKYRLRVTMKISRAR